MVDTAGKLTMSAWADMQQEWSKNTESKELTGILLWDFSAAFDTLDVRFFARRSVFDPKCY